MILPITLTIAGAAALLNIWLGYRVGQMRLTHKISIGDGGNEPLDRPDARPGQFHRIYAARS